MISTRQLIFIISIVFFFVNRATSADASSSNVPNDNLSNEEVEEEVGVEEEVNSEHLMYCKLEITTPFPKPKPFDNFLHAFLYINTADFEVTRKYTNAAYKYFYDLLHTVRDLNTPSLENPKNYCETSCLSDQFRGCLRGIAEIGCPSNDDGVNCVQKLYLNWKKDDESFYVRQTPFYGTSFISDDELETALSRGTHGFRGLSYEEVSSHLTERYLLEEFYGQNEDRRDLINDLQRKKDECITDYHEAVVNQSREPSYENNINQDIAQRNYYDVNRQYHDLRENDIKDARESCYGIRNVPYNVLLDEYNRRKHEYKQYGNAYAMHLYDQLRLFGQKMKLDSEENRIFKDPENFCVTFLKNNRDYYYWL